MLKHAHIGRIGGAVVAATLIITLLFLLGAAAGWIRPLPAAAYESHLFRPDTVHTLDIDMDDWDAFLETCRDESYAVCSVAVDGESFGNVGIRAKGNSSLASVARFGNDRYSFKVEFDHYNEGSLYYGLDKLSLNNLFSDSTYLKDYVTYELMRSQGVAAPLCSFVQITVNGVDWGLYLAVEGVEDSFLRRNYGADYGNLYKPEGAGINAGPENGPPAAPVDARPELGQDGPQAARNWLGSPALRLQYIDDDPDSYAPIFDNAKTNVSDSDKDRLIQALETLGSGADAHEAVDTDAVIRYLVVHDFVRNGDSYTGTMVHNYYLYEEEGRLSMIPWDYNMAFGQFAQMGVRRTASATVAATAEVNAPIDSPVTGGTPNTRPMIGWIFSDATALDAYHAAYAAFLDEWFGNGRFSAMLEETVARIEPYVASDPTAFCSVQDFRAGTEALAAFCALRAESVRGQLSGTIPSTLDGQTTDRSTLVDASGISLEAMGSVGGAPGENRPVVPQDGAPEPGARVPPENTRPQGALPAGNPEPAGAASAGVPAATAALLALSLVLLAGGILFALHHGSFRHRPKQKPYRHAKPSGGKHA